MDTDVKGFEGQGEVDLVRFEEGGSELFLIGEMFSRFARSNSLQIKNA